MKGFLLIVAATACISLTSGEEREDEDLLSKFALMMDKPVANRTVVESWQKMENMIREMSNSAVKSMLPFLMDSFHNLNLTNQCVQNIMNVVLGVKKIRPWAVRFLDASGKFMDGFLVGSPTSFGNYDECVDTEVRSERRRDNGKLLYRGQYCIINMVPLLPEKGNFYKMDDVGIELKNFSKQNTIVGEMAKHAALFHFVSIRFGICVPTGCSLEDINRIAKYAGDMVSLNATVSRCEAKEANEYTPLIITVLSIICFLFFLMTVGTVIDLYNYYTKASIKSNFL